MLALVGRQWHGYDGFDHTASHAMNPQVAALLDGEQLVPPPALPPEMFMTREVQSAKPLVATASRQWELLDAEFRQRLLAVFKIMREQHNVEMVLIEGYRSPERQAALAALGPTVTHAGAGRSYHQHGLAADCAFLFDGRVVISEQDARAARAYEQYGEVARSLGLVWGGGWRSLKDLGHVELRRAGVLDAAAREDKQS
jgi:peptidoglycan LD-endopeptidase CwlK